MSSSSGDQILDNQSNIPTEFTALLVKDKEPLSDNSLCTCGVEDLPEGDTIVKVEWSCLNYKDALGLTGKAPILRMLPMVPGIDLSGVVVSSDSIPIGTKVVLNGYGVGETRWGGFTQYARVPADWLITLSNEYDTWDAMAHGTAGYTAMLCVNELRDKGVTPDKGRILVTGASGGVGSVAILVLKALGYDVFAVSSRESTKNYLTQVLGANGVITPVEINPGGKPFGRPQWAGVVDVCGGQILADCISATVYNGVVAACGLAAGAPVTTNVMPFILRGVCLAGVDSVQREYADRQRAWADLEALVPSSKLKELTTEVDLQNLVASAHDLIDQKLTGRVVVRIPH